MDLLKRLFNEFWFPAVISLGWTFFSGYTSDDAWTIKAFIVTFTPSFFLVSWATGQFFRIKKQANVERSFSSLEVRVTSLIEKLEKLTKDFLGYTVGADSLVFFQPMIFSPDRIELALFNNSTYPAFDVFTEMVDQDKPYDPSKGREWHRRPFHIEKIYPRRAVLQAYTLDMTNEDQLNLVICISTRSQIDIVQSIRLAKVTDRIAIADKVTVAGEIVSQVVPTDFPGYDPANPDAVFK